MIFHGLISFVLRVLKPSFRQLPTLLDLPPAYLLINRTTSAVHPPSTIIKHDHQTRSALDPPLVLSLALSLALYFALPLPHPQPQP